MSTLDRGNLDTYLVDKSSILCALSIRQIEMKYAKALPQHRLSRKGNIVADTANTRLLRHNSNYTLTTLSNRHRLPFPSDSRPPTF